MNNMFMFCIYLKKIFPFNNGSLIQILEKDITVQYLSVAAT